MKLTLILSMLLFNVFCMGQMGGKRMDCIMRMMKDSGLSTWSPKGSGTTIDSVLRYGHNIDEGRIIDSIHPYDSTVVFYFHDGNIIDSNVIRLLYSNAIDTIIKQHLGSGTTAEVKTSIGMPIYDYGNVTTPDIQIVGKGITTGEIKFKSPERKRDTVPVILIVIDTSSRISLLMIITDPLSKAKSDGRLPFWIKGYSIRELHSTAEEFDSGMTPKELWGIWWGNISYLDENKQPLPESIIVWDAREINH